MHAFIAGYKYYENPGKKCVLYSPDYGTYVKIFRFSDQMVFERKIFDKYHQIFNFILIIFLCENLTTPIVALPLRNTMFTNLNLETT